MTTPPIPESLPPQARALVDAAGDVGGAVIVYGADDRVIWVNDGQRHLVPEIDYGEATYESIFWHMLQTGKIGNTVAQCDPHKWLAVATASRRVVQNMEFVNSYPWGQMLVSQLRLDGGESLQARVNLEIAGIDRYFDGPAVGVGVILAAQARREVRALEAALDGLELAIGLVNRGGGLIHANASLTDLLAAGDGLRLARDGALAAWHRLDDIVLQQALDAATATEARRPFILTARRPNGHEPHVLAVSPGASPGTAVLTLSRFGEDIDTVAAALQQAFRLTAAEAQVTARLGAGMSVADIAADRGTTKDTTYNQVRNLKETLRRSAFSVSGLHDIATLVAKVAAVARALKARS